MLRRIVAAALATALTVMPLWAHSAERKADALAVQVALDRLGFSPGVIDGAMGGQTQKALRGFQEANGLEITGQLDEDTRAACLEAGADEVFCKPLPGSVLRHRLTEVALALRAAAGGERSA